MQVGEPPLIYEETEETSTHRYVGGTAYVLIDAKPEQVMKVLNDTNSFWHVLPKVSDLRPAGVDGQDRLVEIEHGTSIAGGHYTVRIHPTRVVGSKQMLRFWIDPSRPHSLRDAYGSFEVEPYTENRSLFTWRIRIDLGPGLVRWLFEDKVRTVALTTAELVRSYVEGQLRNAKSPVKGN